ncbi:MAG TPA: dihydrofolate reductase family protein [Pseudonocardiaceae bacterium]|jgi:dihydrofolate reductase|nr:dihydrofolate reductase family protein [Pseudonocardiaceae bacterium]
MKLTVNTFLTLDGVMQGPGGADEDTSGGFTRGGWLLPHADEDMGAIVTEWFAEADEILLGRTTYDMMQSYWRQVTDPENGVAVALNTLPKHVVSTTLTEATWSGSTIIADDVVATVTALKAKPGRELQVHGSCALARTLHDHGLIDEYRLLVFPVVLGAGKRLFEAGAVPASFKLIESRATSAGAVALTFRPTDAPAIGTLTVVDGKEAVLPN